ncbi:hypothetical protein ILUMI_09624 [Ignelater luminosus]|uniref:THAP-type domain-containing protein n=1 Tax=Ignelater luminosus TaxID=2038154 RepID=A0A8K0CZN9_IGNLU|nr:hypothetical protein ILUMI_09624 [Ignelater luminosus]
MDRPTAKVSTGSKSKNNCCVPQCSSTYRDPGLKIGKAISPYMKVCSLHFKKEDYFFPDVEASKRRLKQGCVPSQNLPKSSHERFPNAQLAKERATRAEKRHYTKMNEQSTPTPSVHQELGNPIKFEGNNQAVENLLYFKENPVIFKTFEDKAIQVNTFEEFNRITVDKLVDSDYKCNVLLGLPNLGMIDILANLIIKAFQSNSKYSLSVKQKVILTFLKLKLNLSFACLAVLFGTTSKTARLSFYNTVEILSAILKPIIRFPSKEEMLNNMPKCFTPSGLITFLSKGYGGRVSDKAIFNKENVIQKLDMNDSIMVDKGILIEKECNEHLIKLIRPPFLKKTCKQFSKADAERTASIARARVHVERAIQRIKIFKICQGTLQWLLLPYMDDIMIIIAAITNLSAPILSEDKFIT